MITQPLQPSVSGRRPKLVGLDDVSTLLKSLAQNGSSICLGGLFKQNRPVALVRELIRSGIKDIRLFSSPGSGYDADLLIAAGIIAETYLPAVTLENRFCPNFRAAVERQHIKAHAVDALTIIGGLMAAANGVPFQPVTAWAGSDILHLNPLIREMTSPFGEGKLYAVPPIEPDIVLLHAQEGDEFGNVRHLSTMTYADALMARAGKHVVVSVDKLVPHDAILRDPRGTTIAGIYVDAIVEAPFGAHPTASFPNYAMDEDAIEDFADMSDVARRTEQRQALDDYIRTHVLEPGDIYEYIDTFGGYRTVARLERMARFL
jgi:glutaconate CoA-transferase subunit A